MTAFAQATQPLTSPDARAQTIQGTQASRTPMLRPWQRLLQRHSFLSILLAILIGVGGVAALIIASLQLMAISTYNAASHDLHEHMQSARQWVDAAPQRAFAMSELTNLIQRQERTDAQFQEALQCKLCLMPMVARSIEHNAVISEHLTQALKQVSQAQRAESEQHAHAHNTPPAAGNASSNNAQSPSAMRTHHDTFTPEERQRINAILGYNAPSSQPQQSQQSPTSPSGGTSQPEQSQPSTVKPW